MHIKTTMRYHLTLVRMVIMKKPTNSKCWRKWNSLKLLVRVQTDITTMENNMETPLKTRKKITNDLAIPLLGIYLEETRSEKHTPVFTVALFTVARIWEQPSSSLTDRWIKKLWYKYTMECYSAIKNNTPESVLIRWMKLEPIIQSEVSQKEKHQYSILTHIYGI